MPATRSPTTSIRRRLRLALAGALLLACESRPSASPAPTGPPPTPPATAPSASSPRPARDAPLDFVEFVTGGARRTDRLPLVVAIHGLGDEPRSFSSVLRDLPLPARVVVPAGLTPYGRGFAWFPFDRDRAPDRLAQGIRSAASRVADFLRWARQSRATRGRPMITGFSQGGMLSFAVAVTYPDLVSAAFPMGGLLPEPLWPSSAPPKSPPIVAFHGEDDPLVPLDGAERTVAALAAAGHPARLERYAGVPHAVPVAMRRDLYRAIAEAIEALEP